MYNHENKSKQYPVPMFSESSEQTSLNINADIRTTIIGVLKDDNIFKEILAFIMPEGRAGNKMMDWALAADLILKNCDLAERYEIMNHKMVSDQLHTVLKKRGYVIDHGRLTRHGEVAKEKQTQEKAAPEKAAQEAA